MKNIIHVNFLYVTQDECLNTEKFLVNYLSKSITIKGKQKLLGFIPVVLSISKINVKISHELNIEKDFFPS